MDNAAGISVLTIGHSTRSAEEFVALLLGHRVESLVDIRRFPGSRRQPQFGADELVRTLTAAGIAYIGLPALGGRRRPLPDSPNGGWRNAAFQGYADYMGTAEFAAGVADLCGLAATARACVMCSEALPWRCHRWLLADWLSLHGASVAHILGRGPTRPHHLTGFARIVAGRLTYPPVEGSDAAI